jgi:hypothetical protein
MLELLQLLEIELKLELGKLHEQQGLTLEEDGELQDELLDDELFEGEMEDKLQGIRLDELSILLKLEDMQLRLEL